MNLTPIYECLNYMTMQLCILSFIIIIIDIASNQWVGWSGFGGTTDGGGRPAKRKTQSKRKPEMTGQTPSDEKVSMEFRMFGNKSQKNLTFLGFRPVLYIEILEAVTCPNNLPKICGSHRARSQLPQRLLKL